MLATNIYKEISIINALKLVQIHFFQDSNCRLLFKKCKCETVAKIAFISRQKAYSLMTVIIKGEIITIAIITIIQFLRYINCMHVMQGIE